ncbi:RES family NAD+ phosphorylase [Rhodococcus qingshengii]|uniref:RES domain-containing protein n=1 Tax=Rhodococcus qingshengii TaxID=334542 RepID=A0A2A5J1J4_RHOSG|nr:RES family NAD+ phosphorylase [Rhodococcus qingshengii]PCK23232.1 hypothetical protein CHR55_30550 [Rhodococcus qingshengii]
MASTPPEPNSANKAGSIPSTTHTVGTVYCSPTLDGAVAEGILRAKKIPASRIIAAVQVDGRALVRWQLHVDLDVAALRDPHLRKIGLTSSIHSCTRRDYGWSRRVAHAILARNPHVHGLAYPCRNDTHSTALLLVQRPQGPLTEPGAYSLVDMRAPVRDASLRYDIARAVFISAGVVLAEPNPEDEE